MQNYRRPFWEVSRANKAKLRPILLLLTHAQTARVPDGARWWPRPPGCECAGVAGEGSMVSTGLTGSLVASVWRATSKAIRPESRDSGTLRGSRFLTCKCAGAETRPRCFMTSGFETFQCAWRRDSDVAGGLQGARLALGCSWDSMEKKVTSGMGVINLLFAYIKNNLYRAGGAYL